MHLRYDLAEAFLGKNEDRHSQDVMKELGITYQHATPQSVGDQWWFWNCENVPDQLPSFITELKIDPQSVIGYGLSKEDADKISSYKNSEIPLYKKLAQSVPEGGVVAAKALGTNFLEDKNGRSYAEFFVDSERPEDLFTYAALAINNLEAVADALLETSEQLGVFSDTDVTNKVAMNNALIRAREVLKAIS